MALTWSDSADKHGIDREDALHAIANAVYVETEFDEPRPPNDLRPTLYIGPPRRLGGHCWKSWWRYDRHVACTSST